MSVQLFRTYLRLIATSARMVFEEFTANCCIGNGCVVCSNSQLKFCHGTFTIIITTIIIIIMITVIHVVQKHKLQRSKTDLA